MLRRVMCYLVFQMSSLDVLIDTDDIVVESMNDIGDAHNRTVVEAAVDEMPEVTEVEASDERQSLQSRRKSTDVLLLTNEMLQQMLTSLQNHIKASVATRWKTRSSTELKNIIQDSALLKALKHDEVNVLIDHTIDIQKTAGIALIKSWRLQEKCNAISTLLGDGIQIEKERFVKKVTSLRECAARTLRTSNKCNSSSIPKMLLNVIYASVLFPESQKEWIHKSQFGRLNQVQDIGNVEWFSYPEFSLERQRLEPKCVDAHHLLVNLRVKVCKNGLRGVMKKAWHDVVHNYTDVISKSIVEDLIDKQNNAYALKTFSCEVAEAMKKLDYNAEADFCDFIRDWYEAEDCPGLSAVQRTVRRLGVKSFLLRDVDFGSFPIYGMYINGFTRASFEGFLQKIDTNIQLYAIAKNDTYNQSAISSLVNETFFGELSAMGVTRLGCPKAINIPRLMSNETEINHYRCDPSDRMFCMKTTKKSVYPEQSLLDESLDVMGNLSEDNQADGRNTIIFRDHFFDTNMRRRTKQWRSKRTDVSKPNEVARGCQPVRQHHKCDESKILATRRF